jgi:hypothetical protein
MLFDENENPIDDSREEYVPVVHARNEHQAELYQQLLADHDIEALIGYDEVEERDDAEVDIDKQRLGLPVLVREALLDEASEIIAERDDIEDEFEAMDEVADDEEDDEDEFDLEIDPETEEIVGDDDEETDLFLDEEEDEDLFDDDEDEEY